MDLSVKTKPEEEKRERQDWLLVLLILLIGFMCVLGAGQRALFASPNWTMNANMESGIDPNKDFLTKPVDVFEPIDANILTQPAWVKVFLTPGAKFVTGTAPAGPVATNNVPTQGQGTGTVVPTIVNTLPVGTGTAVPTNTFVWLPVTPKPGNTSVPATNTSPPSAPDADLRIQMTSATSSYTPGDAVVYTVTITNAGPDAITNAVITDIIPPAAQVSSWDWVCGPVGGGAGGCNGVAGSNATFTDTVSLPSGGSIEYTVTVYTAATATGNLNNSASITASGYTETNPADNSDDWTHNIIQEADLGITNVDGVSAYSPGQTLNYTMTVTNNGPAAVAGATVTDTFTGGVISTVNWTCPDAACPVAAGSGDINATLGNLPSGGTVTYSITVVLYNTTGGNVTSNASVSLPGGYTDPGPLPNTANDSDTPRVGSGPDCPPGGNPNCVYDLPAGSSLTIYTSIEADGDAGWDLVYYELPHPGIYLDVVRIEISDGTDTYTVFEWGDGTPDINTNVGAFGPETDNFPIAASNLYPPPAGSGVAIDVDNPALNGGLGIPPGTYTQIIITPLDGPGDDGNCGIDGIEVLP